ncbi:MAG: acyl-CoA dehydrogenase C-terminal domain-containing protein [Sphingomonadales bacterium]
MPTYKAPLRDMRFLIHEFIELDKYSNLPGFADATPDIVDAILEEGGKIAAEVLQPLNQSGDQEGCRFDNGVVTSPKGFREAYQTYVEGGWSGLTQDPEYGGQGLPHILGLAFSEMCVSANLSFEMYVGLTNGAVAAIRAHGGEELKQTYLPKMISGEWTGTMNLTEPHCGTDLGMMRTKAEPQDDGSYKITGTKIFISAGEHDLTENIVHLVLAKIPGGPDGIKGVSLFIVPKFLVNDDGGPGARNGVVCGSIEDKMGIHGNSTCVLNYDGATGYLLGDEHKGMRAMFTMMNAARLGVGLQGVSLAEVSYQNAVEYARDRLQGRSLTGPKEPEKPADPIIVHPDVRRMLMNARAFIEGARALAFWTALNLDLAHKDPDEGVRRDAEDLISLLTPVIKGYYTDLGFTSAHQAQQCYGGHGYIREWGMEQFVRDARIAQIYEGANGIQALDLVGRKLASNGGRSIRLFFETVRKFCDEHAGDEDLKPYIKPLQGGLQRLQQGTMWFMQNAMANPDNAGAGSMDYLYLLALNSLGFMWAKMAAVAQEKLRNDPADRAFYENKLITARYFMERLMPDTASHLARIEAGSDSVMALAADAF